MDPLRCRTCSSANVFRVFHVRSVASAGLEVSLESALPLCRAVLRVATAVRSGPVPALVLVPESPYEGEWGHTWALGCPRIDLWTDPWGVFQWSSAPQK